MPRSLSGHPEAGAAIGKLRAGDWQLRRSNEAAERSRSEKGPIRLRGAQKRAGRWGRAGVSAQ
jgi:hypothetical protein